MCQVEDGPYIRRLERPGSTGWLGRLRRARYEVWHEDGSIAVLSRSQLDRLLDGRRFPADYWASLEAADKALAEGDRESWIEYATGRRLEVPPSPSH
jgi:hypothetical protein